jgi:hypothetical protein
MCQFKSAIVVREPRNKGGFALIHSHTTDSHSELIAANELRDDGRLRFARVEYSPEDASKAHLLDTYSLRIDEGRTPEWFDRDMKQAVAAKLAEVVKAMIVPRSGMTLLGGAWIVPPDCEVSVGPMTRIVANYGKVADNHGTVTDNHGTVTENHGTVASNHGTVARNHGTVADNHGTVARNGGTVARNDGTVTYNHGTVTYNRGDVAYNHGTVTDNDGAVMDNYGAVAYNSGTVTDNDGTVTDNHGTITRNRGTVTDNYGAVVQNLKDYGKGVIVSGKQALK